MFLRYIFLFRYSFTFKPTLNALKNLTATVAIVGLQTNSSMLTHPDQHTPNGAFIP